MKERPILFSTPMVQAILEGRKSQTRRIIKMPDLVNNPSWYRYIGNSNDMGITRVAIPYDDRLYHEWQRVNSNAASWVIHSYKPGDVLWVRETWNTLTAYEEKPDYSVMSVREFVYKADDDRFDKWKPSIFMPKEACRIRLLVEDIRVERLQDISEEDAIAEGIEYMDNQFVEDYDEPLRIYCDYSDKESVLLVAKSSYKTLWESINGKGSWDKNPWVWCVKFKRL